ncbi:hypothetical protein [uncultured Erythrobacter sp.]|uniref:hypothetical protein n=1 Tax=uncultured Erythrobacter sp. TaxID=263913 RepID=UPI002639FC8A|nr:hypothetical protein [uncultured Erythrobacter sp.]
MTVFATSISTITVKAALSAAMLALLAASPAHAQMLEEEPDVEDVARTPLEDFNIDSDDIPEVLVIAAQDPYAADGLISCNDIVGEVAALDQVLGADFDLAVDEEGRRISRGRIAKSVIGSFVPFRGIVREVSGANARRREVNTAITAGMVRRGFLKGLGQQRGCDYPASPRPEEAE